MNCQKNITQWSHLGCTTASGRLAFLGGLLVSQVRRGNPLKSRKKIHPRQIFLYFLQHLHVFGAQVGGVSVISLFRIGRLPTHQPSRWRRNPNGEIRLDLLEGDLAIAIRVQDIEGLFLFFHLEIFDGWRNSPPRKNTRTSKATTKMWNTMKRKIKKAPKGNDLNK